MGTNRRPPPYLKPVRMLNTSKSAIGSIDHSFTDLAWSVSQAALLSVILLKIANPSSTHVPEYMP